MNEYAKKYEKNDDLKKLTNKINQKSKNQKQKN